LVTLPVIDIFIIALRDDPVHEFTVNIVHIVKPIRSKLPMFPLTRRELFVTTSAMAAVITLPGCTNSPQATGLDPIYQRKEVQYDTREKPGTIVINPSEHFLYFVEGGGRALRYGVGVGSEGFAWSGVATVRSKQEWPNWYPTNDYLQRQPAVRSRLNLQSGSGMVAGLANPLGARALYLWQGNKDTLYRIHGTNEPWTIGQNVSSGCIRLTNEDVIDLYDRTSIGAKVVVL
jgi:lipoprotein-anchoring transpeptidase ErfK/SrfK